MAENTGKRELEPPPKLKVQEDYPVPAHWWDLKDEVKRRCYRECEFCAWRDGQQLHHRHYNTKWHERPVDVMLVCDRCHRWIHRLTPPDEKITVHVGSLAARLDKGEGLTELWLKYLSVCEQPDGFWKWLAEKMPPEPPVPADGERYNPKFLAAREPLCLKLCRGPGYRQQKERV